MRHRVRKAFTLVEILIVVVILGILAAIVVPQFTSASQEAQAGNVATQLQTIRSQIELFRVKNNGNYPPSMIAGGANAWDDLLPTAGGGNAEYMRTAPVNPRTSSSSVVLGADLSASDPAEGWIFDADDTSATYGQILACYFDEVAYNDGDPATDPWTGP
ncbi:MAG: type II secretion system protein [Phycisphaerales bacterium]